VLPTPVPPIPPQVLHLCLIHTNMNVRAALLERGAYVSIDELLTPMKLMYESLLHTGDESVSDLSRRDTTTAGTHMMLVRKEDPG